MYCNILKYTVIYCNTVYCNIVSLIVVTLSLFVFFESYNIYIYIIIYIHTIRMFLYIYIYNRYVYTMCTYIHIDSHTFIPTYVCSSPYYILYIYADKYHIVNCRHIIFRTCMVQLVEHARVAYMISCVHHTMYCIST